MYRQKYFFLLFPLDARSEHARKLYNVPVTRELRIFRDALSFESLLFPRRGMTTFENSRPRLTAIPCVWKL